MSVMASPRGLACVSRLRSDSLLSTSSSSPDNSSPDSTQSDPHSSPPSFGPRMRLGSILLSDATDGHSRSSSCDNDTSGGTFVDVGQGVAELKDAFEAPWATPKLDENGFVQIIVPEYTAAVIDPKCPISAAQQLHLDRILQRPLIAYPGYQPRQALPAPQPSPAKAADTQSIDAQGARGLLDAGGMASDLGGQKTLDASKDEDGGSETTTTPALLPPIDLRSSNPTLANPLPSFKTESKRDVSNGSGSSRVSRSTSTSASSRGRFNRRSSAGSESGGGRAPPGAVASLGSTGAVEGQRRIGRCKMYNCDKGLGFIVDDILSEVPYDVKLHWTDIYSTLEFKSLAKGEIVEYTLNITANGFSASFVTGPGGRPVMGASDSTVLASRQASFELFKAKALPLKAYRSKWEGLPAPDGFLRSPTLANVGLGGSPQFDAGVVGYAQSQGPISPTLSSGDSTNSLGLDVDSNGVCENPATAHIRRGSGFSRSPVSTASPLFVGGWAQSPQSFVSSPPTPWASASPYGCAVAGSLTPYELVAPGHATYPARCHHASAGSAGASMQQVLAQRESLLSQQVELTRQQRLLAELWVQTTGTQSPPPSWLSPSQASLRPNAQSFVPTREHLPETPHEKPPRQGKSANAPVLGSKRVATDKHEKSKHVSFADAAKPRSVLLSPPGSKRRPGYKAAAAVASAEKAIQALREASSAPKLFVTEPTPVKTK